MAESIRGRRSRGNTGEQKKIAGRISSGIGEASRRSSDCHPGIGNAIEPHHQKIEAHKTTLAISSTKPAQGISEEAGIGARGDAGQEKPSHPDIGESMVENTMPRRWLMTAGMGCARR